MVSHLAHRACVAECLMSGVFIAYVSSWTLPLGIPWLHLRVCIFCGVACCSRKRWSRKSQQVMEPTKMLLLPGEVAPHPNDPVEVRRLMYQTPGRNITAMGLEISWTSSRTACLQHIKSDTVHVLSFLLGLTFFFTRANTTRHVSVGCDDV